MYINKIKIHNFKCFKDYELSCNSQLNILVGMNDIGKTTILEAINLCLTGFFRGKYLKNNLTQDVFNNDCIKNYLDNIKSDINTPLPDCSIELYFQDADPMLLGKENSDNENVACITYKIKFASKYSEDYEIYKSLGTPYSLPIEYYDIEWINSAGKDVTGRTVPYKSILIDTDSSVRNNNDVQISRIIQENLEEKELVGISQLYRKMNDNFINDEIMTNVNKKLSQNTHILNTTIQLDTESLNQSDWEKSVITRINSTPFDFVGKGTQAAIKIELSLTSGKADKSSIILIEEPENHLTYSKMNKLISEITKLNNEKQIFITTHSSFVANKLNIKNLILLSKDKNTSFSRLTPETINFFEKKPGYDTLRLLLCKKAILVEGDADELIVQKAYLNKNGILPIENDIDVISVGNTFLRFLEISTLLEKETIVVTDNDGDIEQLKNKYENYLGKNEKNFIKICYDYETHIEQGNLRSKNGGTFNYDTLEPCMLRANNLDTLNEILETNKSTDDELIYYMVNNKTECALKIFDTTQNIKFPKYIEDSINE